MAKASTDTTIARQWELLRLLPGRRPGATAAELRDQLDQAGFPVAKRTVERDLLALSKQFPITTNDKGKPWGWHWMEGASLELPALSLSDALSLQLVESLLEPLLPSELLESLKPRFTQAKAKLDALSQDNPTARWADKVRYVSPTLPLVPPTIDAGVLQGLHRALIDDRQIDVCYQRPGNLPPKRLRLHPLGLVQRGSATYLVATAFQYSDRRIYAVQRITELTVTDDSVNRPEEFDLDGYIGAGAFEFGDGESIELVATVNDWIADLLSETPLTESQTLEPRPDGRSRVTATLRDSWQLRWWLLSQGQGIVVEQPKALRRWIQQTIANMHHNYGEPE